MNKNPASRLAELESCKLRHGRGCAAPVEKLLVSMRSVEFGDAESLVRFHDALLFLRAFPKSRKVIRLTENLLAGIAKQVARLRDSGADMSMFDSEQVSGIAGTVINDTFTYEVRRLVRARYPKELKREWDLD